MIPPAGYNSISKNRRGRIFWVIGANFPVRKKRMVWHAVPVGDDMRAGAEITMSKCNMKASAFG
jgi:hypothetical protein